MRPTFLASWIWAMPDTTVQKMIGAITILISLMKPSPSALIQSLVARLGHSQPTSAPSTMAISTWTYSILYQGFAALTGSPAAMVVVVMTFTPPQIPSDCFLALALRVFLLVTAKWACGVNGVAPGFSGSPRAVCKPTRDARAVCKPAPDA